MQHSIYPTRTPNTEHRTNIQDKLHDLNIARETDRQWDRERRTHTEKKNKRQKHENEHS